jgi:hypothetical protein
VGLISFTFGTVVEVLRMGRSGKDGERLEVVMDIDCSSLWLYLVGFP